MNSIWISHFLLQEAVRGGVNVKKWIFLQLSYHTQRGASIPAQTSLMSPFDTFDCAADLRILVDISLKSLKLLQSSNLHCLKRSKYTAQ